MKPERSLGREIHAVSNLMDRRMGLIVINNGADDITPMHGMMLGFINDRQRNGHDIYQKDIEVEFDIARSTVTATLKLMEKKGYIRREGVAHDARLKRILLTSFGKECFERIHSSIQQTEELMRKSMSEQEHDQLMQLLERLKSVL